MVRVVEMRGRAWGRRGRHSKETGMRGVLGVCGRCRGGVDGGMGV